MKRIFSTARAEIFNFMSDTRQNQLPREDYKEFLNLAKYFLGDNKWKLVIYAPGAFHHARWMIKAIYSLNIYLFTGHFKLSESELEDISDICVFIKKVCIEAWFTSTRCMKAPQRDNTFL